MEPIEVAYRQLKKAEIPLDLENKWLKLIENLRAHSSAVIAYSGGVDSSFLAYACFLVMADRMVAITVLSPLEPAGMHDQTVQFAKQIGFKHVIMTSDPLQDPLIQKNPPDRCYFCKKNILNDLWDYAKTNHYNVVIEGQNADDQFDYRPGSRAVIESSTLSPLAQSGLTKADIRQLAKAFGLSVWNLPSSPCLASRVPYGNPITNKALDQIGLAEKYLHEKGFETVRVRHYGKLAKIEISTDFFPMLLENHADLVRYFKQIGFQNITLDLEGYRMGSLNEGITR